MRSKQEELEYLQEHGINFIRNLNESAWPKQFFNTLKQIQTLGSYRITEFCNNAISRREPGRSWNCETGLRARTLAATCRALTGDDISEMEWRLRVEELFLSRFRSEIYCRFCKHRLWRSEIEAVVELPGPAVKILEERRIKRYPCLCQNWLESMILHEADFNNMFSSRADERVRIYDPTKNEVTEVGKKSAGIKRPDRVFGFHKSGGLKSGLESMTSLLQKLPVTNPVLKKQQKATILDSKSAPLLFPFLVIEAKSEAGDGFDGCWRQTAMPIREMLKLQQGLISQSKVNLKYGGPLVWYIAHKGEEWRLYACYTEQKKGETRYNIHEVCSKRPRIDDDALQVLLIVDYIFDWARDIYRLSIIEQLNVIVDQACVGLETNFSRASTQSDTHSIDQNRPNSVEEACKQYIKQPLERCLASKHFQPACNFDVFDAKLNRGDTSVLSRRSSELAILDRRDSREIAAYHQIMAILRTVFSNSLKTQRQLLMLQNQLVMPVPTSKRSLEPLPASKERITDDELA